MSITVIEPLMAPATVGVNVTATLHVAPGFSVEQVLVWAKFALAPTDEIVTAVVPLFFSVTDLLALVVPRSCAAKAKLNGVGVTTG